MMRTLMTLLAFVAAGVAPTTDAATWHIEADGSGDRPTIQAAVQAASSGDTIELAPGNYTGAGNRRISFGGKDLLLRSSGGRDATFIDCEGLDRAMDFVGGETASSVIEGITFENGYAAGPAGCIYFRDFSSPTFNDCTFRNNQCSSQGGTFFMQQSAPSFNDCLIIGSRAPGRGGAAFLENSSHPVFTRCAFIDNATEFRGGAVASTYICNPLFRSCLFWKNRAAVWGGAMYIVESSKPTIVQSTLVENEAPMGSAVLLNFSGDHSITIHNSIIAHGIGDVPIYCGRESTANVTCTTVFGHDSGNWVDCLEAQAGVNGNQEVDPLFCDAEAGDFALQWGSPCLPAGSACGQQGRYGFGGCNSIAVESESWAGIKARYR